MATNLPSGISGSYNGLKIKWGNGTIPLQNASASVIGFIETPINTNTMNQRDYINKVLIDGIGEVTKNQKWLSYGLITSGIEFLGICLDKKFDFFEPGHSEDRFKDAIDKLFPIEYKKYNNLAKSKQATYDLYKELRCGLNHTTFPQAKIGLSEKAHHKKIYELGGKMNLTISNTGHLILVVEDFYEDFVGACEQVITQIEKGNIEEKIYLIGP